MLLNYVLTVSPAEADLIGQALGELPLKLSKGLFENLQRQVMQQQLEAQQPEIPPEAPPAPGGEATNDNLDPAGDATDRS